MRGIGKTFPGVRALEDVSLDLYAGEIHALVGENGAGKSTLMKILAGAQRADAGEITIDGKTVVIDSPRTAENLSVGMIYQEFNLVPALNAVDNIVLGNEPAKGLLLDERAARARAEAVFGELAISLPLNIETSQLRVAQQQLIEIAKVLSRNARIIVMDEPTAALTNREITKLFEVIRALKARGVGIVYISHRLEELPQIADRVTVLRDGRVIETRAVKDFPPDEIIRAMVGRRLEAHFPELPPVAPGAAVALKVQDLTRSPAVNGVSFEVRQGEIVGLAGLVGAGRTEIVRAIAGADIPQKGTIEVQGRVIRIRSLGMSVRENVTLAHLGQFVERNQLIDRRKEEQTTREYIDQLQIRTPGTEQLVRNLSGGNQQKVVLAKWLLGNAKVFLFDEPTRGIDVGAKAEIYDLMIKLAAGGAGIVMVSSELPEVLGMAHRILVIRGGQIVREFARADATPDAVIAAATGAAA